MHWRGAPGSSSGRVRSSPGSRRARRGQGKEVHPVVLLLSNLFEDAGLFKHRDALGCGGSLMARRASRAWPSLVSGSSCSLEGVIPNQTNLMRRSLPSLTTVNLGVTSQDKQTEKREPLLPGSSQIFTRTYNSFLLCEFILSTNIHATRCATLKLKVRLSTL